MWQRLAESGERFRVSSADYGSDATIARLANQARAPFIREGGDFFVVFAGVSPKCAARSGCFTAAVRSRHNNKVLQSGRTRVGSLDQYEDAGAVFLTIVDERLHAVAAEQRIHGQGVGVETVYFAIKALRAADKGGRVGGGGDADVTALGVGDDYQTSLGCTFTEVLEGFDPRRSVLLEAGELELDGHRMRRHGVDNGDAELLETGADLM